jgi:hypothetical protein
MALDANRLLGRLGDVSLEKVDDAIDYHQRRIDALRLLRQIIEIRDEAKIAGENERGIERLLEDGDGIGQRRHKRKHAYEMVAEAMRDRGVMSTQEIADAAGVGYSAAHFSLSKSSGAAMFDRVGPGRWKLKAMNGTAEK